MSLGRCIFSFVILCVVCVVVSFATEPIWLVSSGTKPIIQQSTVVQAIDLHAEKLQQLVQSQGALRKDIVDLRFEIAAMQQKLAVALRGKTAETPKRGSGEPRPATSSWQPATSGSSVQATTRTVVKTMRANGDATANRNGEWVWRQYSDGKWTKQHAPLRRVSQSAAVRAVGYPARSYTQRGYSPSSGYSGTSFGLPSFGGFSAGGGS